MKRREKARLETEARIDYEAEALTQVWFNGISASDAALYHVKSIYRNKIADRMLRDYEA